MNNVRNMQTSICITLALAIHFRLAPYRFRPIIGPPRSPTWKASTQPHPGHRYFSVGAGIALFIYTGRAPDYLIAFVGPRYGKLSLCLSYIINIFISAHNHNLDNW